MADEEPESFIQKMCREQWLSLDVLGGRVLVNSASKDDLDRCTVELNCRWATSWLHETSIRIGDEQHAPAERALRWRRIRKEAPDEPEVGWDLADCRLTVSVYEATQELVQQSGDGTDGKLLGLLQYCKRVNSGDGVVNDKRPGVHVYVGLGPRNFSLLRDQLLARETPDFGIGVNVQFPRASVETGYVDTKVQWDGEHSLPVTGANIVWPRSQWDSDAVEDEQMPDESTEYEPPREHVELLGAVERLEASMVKLTTPIWIAAGAALAAAVAIISR